MPILPITNKCNQRCVFCCAEYRRNDLVPPLRDIFKEIERSGNLITISGGEPTLSANLFKIIDYAKKNGKNVELQTNGATLSYFDLAKRLFQSGVDLFNINTPSHRKDLSDRITRTEGFYKKRMEGIKNLEKLGANIRLTHLINSLTYRDLPKYIDWVKKNFHSIKYIQFSFIKIFAGAKETSIPVPSYLVPRYEEVEPYLINALKECHKYKIDFIVDHIPICFLGSFFNHHIDFIKIKSNKLNELQHSLEEKKKIKICSRCKLKNFCCGPRGDYLKFFNNKIILRPVIK